MSFLLFTTIATLADISVPSNEQIANITATTTSNTTTSSSITWRSLWCNGYGQRKWACRLEFNPKKGYLLLKYPRDTYESKYSRSHSE